MYLLIQFSSIEYSKTKQKLNKKTIGPAQLPPVMKDFCFCFTKETNKVSKSSCIMCHCLAMCRYSKWVG